MKLFIVAVFLLATVRGACGELISPDGQYKIEYLKSLPHESNVKIMNAKTGKVLGHASSNGYGDISYLETAWSPDSRYLAVVERGTRTTAELSVFTFSGDSMEVVRVPDYRLNLLGRRHLVVGGRYHWVSKLRWDEDTLTFQCNGQWSDGSGDPEIDPGNWYDFDVSLMFGGRGNAPAPRLTSVTATKPGRQGGQDGTGRPPTRHESELEGGQKPQPEAEESSR